jgi:hypothetical protein
MKHIGHVDGATDPVDAWKTHSLGMLSPHDLFIPNPGERENVDADRWRHIGWINPDKDGGVIWDSHSKAGENSRPAYIPSDKPVPVFQDGPHVSGPNVVYNSGGKTDPIDVRRSEFEALRKEFMVTVRRVQEIGRDLIDQRPEPAAPPEAPTGFIRVETTIDPIDVRRSEFTAHAGALDSLTKAVGTLTRRLNELANSTNERIWALEKVQHQPTNQLRKDIEEAHRRLDAFGQTVNVAIQRINDLRFDLQKPSVIDRAPPESPMTFYDHAFLSAWSELKHDYPEMQWMDRVKRAHSIADRLTANRTPKQ